ncbi:CoA-binding protein, partial [Cupriavidus necator]|uniref:CoA-binding protein n=1 Tax=Cupriavidus necator TaxID=106590 RepID=UPI0030F48EAA
MSLDTIETILNPRAVAIVGASDELQKWGGSMLALLCKFKFGGRIYPVNPKSPEVQGLPAFPSVRAIPAPVDVALIAVPNERAIDAIQDCANAGVKAVLMVTSQFAESGEAGRALQEKVVALSRAAGMRIIGPNCMGYFSSHTALCLLNSQALMRNAVLPKGDIALISQSGALAGTMLARAYDIGAGFSFCVSLGNQADLEVCDFLEYAIANADTRVISLYVEGLKDPARFLALLREARAGGKPVLLTKAGRTGSGQRAVQSHTASMAGAYQAFEAAVRHAGAVIVDDPLELVVQSAAWASLAAPASDGVAVFSGSGGGGAVASDMVDEAGLRPAVLTAATVDGLASLIPASAAHLPLDVGSVPANYRTETLGWLDKVLAAMMADDNVGAGLFVMTTQPD